MGRAQSAIAHARQALAIGEQGNALEVTRQAWEQLAASQEQAGDLAGALVSFRRFQQVNDRIFNEDRARRVEVLERRYQAERRESELAVAASQTGDGGFSSQRAGAAA